MKKKIKIIFAVFFGFILSVAAAVGVFFLTYTPTLTFDLSNKTGAVTSGASGYLYGLAEYGVPSAAMCESVDISSVSQKAIDGLQHPIGDIDHVAVMLQSTDYNVVYLQDAYPTWYYQHDAIMQMRADGTYDWQKFLDEDFLPKVRETVAKLSAKDYGEKVVYCLYNECDNGVWFGETHETDDPNNAFGVWAEYNTAGRDAFNSAWKQTFETVREINPDALIGGPGFCDYDHDEIEYFLRFCVENDCVPDIMIYHELHDDSVYYWENHVEDYRQMEAMLGIAELPIIVTEYGRMQDNGYPGKMVQYITRIENSKVYANNAYWRLANNLNDVCADDNSPNANWWLMRWYADLEGETLASESHDLFKSDFERSIRNEKELDHQGFMGIATIYGEQMQINVICGGRSGKAKVVIENTEGTNFGTAEPKVVVEETVYKGLYGIVNEPFIMNDYTVQYKKNKIVITFDSLDEANAYHIILDVEDDFEGPVNENLPRPQRLEFEHGTLLGNAYLYDSYCPTSGDLLGMVGGMENDGDGVQLTFSVPEDGVYNLDFVYGNSNDGAWLENGKVDPNGRVHTIAKLKLDGEEQEIALPNTIKSEYTSCYTINTELTAGEHTLSVSHVKGTYVLDSLVVSKQGTNQQITVLKDADRCNETTQAFLAVAPADGYYEMLLSAAEKVGFSVDGAKATSNEEGKAVVYLRRGLNILEIENRWVEISELLKTETDYSVNSMVLQPSAAVLENTQINENDFGVTYIDAFPCENGSAAYTLHAAAAGDYRMTILYANNDEGGVHDYNVDLIERYITLDVNGAKQNVFCRNTYSWETFKTVTVNIALQEGENTIVLSNSGEIRFNDNETYTPYIATITVNPVAVW